jgi:hypothetical protein
MVSLQMLLASKKCDAIECVQKSTHGRVFLQQLPPQLQVIQPQISADKHGSEFPLFTGTRFPIRSSSDLCTSAKSAARIFSGGAQMKDYENLHHHHFSTFP